MPAIDEAIERAARAISMNMTMSEANWEHYVIAAKAAISAFLADVPVSEAARMAFIEHQSIAGVTVGIKAYCTKLAEEIQ